MEKPQALFRTIFQGGVYASYAMTSDGQRFLVGAARPGPSKSRQSSWT